MDKFLTDLASYAGADSVSVDWRGFHHDPACRFEVVIGFRVKQAEHGWALLRGEGPTVDEAMAVALANVDSWRKAA